MSQVARPRAAGLAVALVGCGAALVLSGCGSGLNHGVITGKNYEAAWTTTQTQCYAYSTSGACTVSVPVPVTFPAEYELDLKDGSQTGAVDVDEGTWDAARVGDYWPPAAGQ